MVGKYWKELVADKRKRQKETIPNQWLISVPPDTCLDVTNIPEQCGLLSATEIEITNASVEILLHKLAKREWSAVEVATAFSKRAIIAHQLTNCLAEIFIDRALSRAAELDDHLAITGNVLGPLHGLPVSLKDQLCIKGLETVMGYASWVGIYAEKNAVLVDILEAAGAILFVRTNVPQTLMWPETYNLVFGRTVNAYNRSLTSGGPSGGEGALISLKGSPLRVGSDIGGSIRIPSAFCGIYGFRPSYNHVPYALAANSIQGQDSIPSVFGPLSNSIYGLKLLFRTVLDAKPWLKDPLVIRKVWDEQAYQLSKHGGTGAKLCYAIMWDDWKMRPHPPILRGLQIAQKALIAAGHKVIDWEPVKHVGLYAAINAIYGAGAQEDYAAVTSTTGEPVILSMSPEEECPVKVARPGLSAYELFQVQKNKRDLRKVYLDHWEATAEKTGTGRPVDAIISPCAAYAAPPHGTNKFADYTMIWNALDYPALVIPVSAVDPDIDVKQPPHDFYCDADEANYESYEPSIFAKAPISLQVVAHTQEDEALLSMSEIVDEAIKAFLG